MNLLGKYLPVLAITLSLIAFSGLRYQKNLKQNLLCSSHTSSDSRLKSRVKYTIRGIASFYGFGDGFHGRSTASGEIFDAHGLTAAHKTLSFGTKVIVKNPENGKEVTVTINDRGPYHGKREIDLSYAAAQKIGIIKNGIKHVEINVVG